MGEENETTKVCCFLPIDRENPRKAIPTINRAAKLLKEQEVSVGIYPEGTRGKDCRLLPFHNGVFKIAQKAEAPIAVLSITGTEKYPKGLRSGLAMCIWMCWRYFTARI